MAVAKPKLPVKFFRTIEGREPVREWLKALPAEERKAIGDDIRTVQFGWPIGMPLVRKMESGLWEVRVGLPSGIAPVLFTDFDGEAVLLHGFFKKGEKTPLPELKAARQRKKLLK